MVALVLERHNERAGERRLRRRRMGKASVGSNAIRAERSGGSAECYDIISRKIGVPE